MKDPETLDLFGDGGHPPPAPSSAPPGGAASSRGLVPDPGHEGPSPAREPAPDGVGRGRVAVGLAAGEVERQPPAEPPVLTVSQANRAVRNLLERQVPPLWITGEVANWTRARSGHCYFTLKDDQAQLRCVIWRRDAARLPMDLEDGMKVRGFGTLTLYEGRGEFQFSVREVSGEEGEGLWRLAFERLRRALEQEGLLDPARKRPLPRFPRTVGVVTSTSGAALRDILSVIRRRAPWTRVVVRGARVQGEGAAREVADAIRVLASSGLPDVLIVGRGGGSIEDLWAFNEEVVARAIVASPIPVISAVGHEVDVTIADLVADLRAPTPSAGAEAAVQDGEAILELLRRVRPRLARGLRAGVEARRLRMERHRDRLQGAVRRTLGPHRVRIERQQERLVRVVRGLTGPRHDRAKRLIERAERAARRVVEAPVGRARGTGRDPLAPVDAAAGVCGAAGTGRNPPPFPEGLSGGRPLLPEGGRRAGGLLVAGS